MSDGNQTTKPTVLVIGPVGDPSLTRALARVLDVDVGITAAERLIAERRVPAPVILRNPIEDFLPEALIEDRQHRGHSPQHIRKFIGGRK